MPQAFESNWGSDMSTVTKWPVESDWPGPIQCGGHHPGMITTLTTPARFRQGRPTAKLNSDP